LHGGIRGTDADLKVIAPVVLAAAAAIQVDDNLVGAEFELRDLHIVTGIDGGAARGHGAVQKLGVQRFTHRKVETLFAGNPFPHAPPRQVRAVLWQYWFTTPGEKRSQGLWWRRELLGLYAPTLEREEDGRILVLQWPSAVEPRE